MTEALALGEKLLSLLEESARTTTYKPALLLALIDRAQEYVEQDSIPVGALAERVVELYWPRRSPIRLPEVCQTEPDQYRAGDDRPGDPRVPRPARYCSPGAAAGDPTGAWLGAARHARGGNARRAADPPIAASVRGVPLQL